MVVTSEIANRIFFVWHMYAKLLVLMTIQFNGCVSNICYVVAIFVQWHSKLMYSDRVTDLKYMHGDMHTYIDSFMHAYIHKHTDSCMSTYTHTWSIYIHICMQTYMLTYSCMFSIYTYISTCKEHICRNVLIHAHLSKYIKTYMHANMHVCYIHTCIHTYINSYTQIYIYLFIYKHIYFQNSAFQNFQMSGIPLW